MGPYFEKKMSRDLMEKFYRKIKLLNETIWEKRATRLKIDSWLNNFKEEDRVNALYLLTEFVYFNKFQIETLLVSVYKDLYKYKQIEEIRKSNSDTLDESFINTEFEKRLDKTRFVILGNPSESSAHLMYIFRNANKLSKNLFLSDSDIDSTTDDIEHFVFIDDLCGSGSQAVRYSKRKLASIKSKFPSAVTSYYMLISTRKGKKRIITETMFNNVDSILELDDSYKCFEDNCRVFQNKDDEIDINKTKEFCAAHGRVLMKSILEKDYPLKSKAWIDSTAEADKFGFSDGQLLIGFHHNTPDNTLPIIWYNEEMINWTPIFKRHNKVY